MRTTDGYYNCFSGRFWLGRIDLRPLGLMRVAFGGLVVWSILGFAPELLDFFSDDQGVAPRSAILHGLVRDSRVSLFDLAGPTWMLLLLYGVTLAAALLLMIGWHTRAASVVAFLMVTSLHERNLMVLDGSDNVTRVLLFWLMFMPSGARYSVDAWLRLQNGKPLVTHSIAFPIRIGQLQVAWIYLNSAMHKSYGAVWHNGTALGLALGLDHMFTTPFGHLMSQQHWFTSLGTNATMAIEWSFLPLCFVPISRPDTGPLARLPRWIFQPTWKAVALAAGTALHIGIALLMLVGNFSYIMMSSYFLLYEPAWVERVLAPLRSGIRVLSLPNIFAQGREMLRHVRSATTAAWEARRQQLHKRSTTALFALQACLLLACMWTSMPDNARLPPMTIGGTTVLTSIDLSPARIWRPLIDTIDCLEIWQKWDMFSPKPMDHDEYLMGRGELADGTEVDVLRGERGNGGALLPPVYPNRRLFRWTKYESELLRAPDNSPWVQEFGRFVCRKWNSSPPNGRALLKTFRLYRESHRVALPGDIESDGWHEKAIWNHTCAL
jgi:hypothetical protein